MTTTDVRACAPGDGTCARTRPVVLVADLQPWEGFLQFAAALRRRGIRVERLTAARRSPVRRVNDLFQRLVYHRVRPVLPVGGAAQDLASAVLAQLPRELLAVEAVDVVAAAVAGAPAVPLRTADLETERLLYDKLAMTEQVAAHGVAVPHSWPAEADVPLTPPFVIKPRLGSGGTGVELVTDAESAARAREWARARPGELMVQEWAPGELLHVAGVARQGALVQVICYRAVGASHSAFGPSAEVLTLDDPEVVEQVERLMAGLGYTGAFCLDYVRAADGTALLIDLNARIFGSWAALQSAGLDVVGAYLYALGLVAEPPTSRLEAGRRLRILPPDMSLGGPGPLGAVLAAQVRGVVDGAGALGPRWLLSALGRLGSAALIQAVRRARRASVVSAGAAERGMA